MAEASAAMKLRSYLGKAAGLLGALALVLVLPVAVGGSEPVWQPLADTPDPPRQEVSYVALGGRLYLTAGNSRDQDRYDPATDNWTSVASLPEQFEGVDHVHGVAVGGKIVYIGGLVKWEQPFPVIGAVAVYDPATDSFELGEEMPIPRAAGGVAAWRGKVIYAGGLGPDGSVSHVHMYDPEAESWTELGEMPRPRDHFQAVVVGDELYAIGGRDTDDTGGTTEIAAVDVLDLPDDPADLPLSEWQGDATSQPLPTLRGGHGVAVVDECIYVIGGENATGTTGATEVYDIADDTWHSLAPLWTPRHGIQAAVIGSTVHIAGGGEAAFAFEPTTVHEALDVSTDGSCAGGPGEGEGPGEEQPPEPPPAAPGGDDPASTPAGGAIAPTPSKPGQSDPGPGAMPVVMRLAVRPQRIRLDGQGRRSGSRFVIVLSKAGRVRLEARLARHGYRSRGRCVRRGALSSASLACTLWVRRWQRVRALRAGRNVVRFSARAGGRPLPRGRYLLIVKPVESGVDGRPSRAPFRIVR